MGWIYNPAIYHCFYSFFFGSIFFNPCVTANGSWNASMHQHPHCPTECSFLWSAITKLVASPWENVCTFSFPFCKHGQEIYRFSPFNPKSSSGPCIFCLCWHDMVMKGESSRYMLLGVLVDVIGAVASTEKQKIEITYIVTWSRRTDVRNLHNGCEHQNFRTFDNCKCLPSHNHWFEYIYILYIYILNIYILYICILYVYNMYWHRSCRILDTDSDQGRTASRRAGKVEYSPGGYGTQSGTTGGGVTVAYWCF